MEKYRGGGKNIEEEIEMERLLNGDGGKEKRETYRGIEI